MVRPMREDVGEEENGDASDQFQDCEGCDESMEIEASDTSGNSTNIRNSGGFSAPFNGMIRDVLRDGADANPLVGRLDMEKGIFQWLQALDLHIIGGCRADERLKPLLKLNASSGAAEDQFMVHLVQHFEASEVAVLARCLCFPLVSVRVGKVNKQGNMLCPTSSRGFLSLSLLPSSHMRISFMGDDGFIERLALVNNDPESSSVIIEDISADTSGRSFLLKLPNSRILYFWCSEKSKVGGMELIRKIKDLLARKPCLTDLTGISKARLDSFATHLWVYILSSPNPLKTASTLSSSMMLTSDFHSSVSNFSSQPKSSSGCIPATYPVYQNSIGSSTSSSMDCVLKNTSFTHEKVKRSGGDSPLNIQCSCNPLSTQVESLIRQRGGAENHGSCEFAFPLLSSFPSPFFSLSPTTFAIPSQISNKSSFFSPYYCWCPPFTSLQYNNTTCHLPTSSDSLSLPPLSTLLSSPSESLVTSKYPLLSVNEFPSRNLTSLLPDPLVHLTMPISSLSILPSSQQIAAFTPFISDPIVHIPIIDICSSGRGYLVSAAGSSLSAAIPSLPISHAGHPLLPPPESLAEKNARETLRMLMASTPALTMTPPNLLHVLPEVLGSMELCRNGNLHVHGNSRFVDVEFITDDTNDDSTSEEMEEYSSKVKKYFGHEPDKT